MHFTLEKRFPCISPWRTEDNVFLPFEFIQVVKNIRNNWIAGKTGELEFNYRGQNYVAKWDQIRKLQNFEYGNLVKMSKLIWQPIPNLLKDERWALV